MAEPKQNNPIPLNQHKEDILITTQPHIEPLSCHQAALNPEHALSLIIADCREIGLQVSLSLKR